MLLSHTNCGWLRTGPELEEKYFKVLHWSNNAVVAEVGARYTISFYSLYTIKRAIMLITIKYVLSTEKICIKKGRSLTCLRVNQTIDPSPRPQTLMLPLRHY